jgi:hypothetical protein
MDHTALPFFIIVYSVSSCVASFPCRLYVCSKPLLNSDCQCTERDLGVVDCTSKSVGADGTNGESRMCHQEEEEHIYIYLHLQGYHLLLHTILKLFIL